MASNPELYQITLPSGVVYDIKDAKARADIEALRNAVAGGAIFLGATTTALSDGSTVATISIGGTDHTAVKGDLVASGAKEYIFDGTKWLEFGDLGALKGLAYKDSASGSFKPTGSVTVKAGSSSTYKPAGTVSKPNVNVTPTTESVTPISNVGTLPALSMTVQNENLTITFSQGTLPEAGTPVDVLTGVSAALSAAPTFDGTSTTLSATFDGTSGTVNVS